MKKLIFAVSFVLFGFLSFADSNASVTDERPNIEEYSSTVLSAEEDILREERKCYLLIVNDDGTIEAYEIEC